VRSFVRQVVIVDHTPGSTTATTIAATFPRAVRATSTLVAFIQSTDTATSATISDSVNGSWPAAIASVDDTDSTALAWSAIFAIKNTAAGTPTVTATYGASTSFRGIVIMEIANVSTSALDKNTQQNQATPGTGADGVTSGNTATLTAQPNIVLGFGNNTTATAGPPAVGTGFTDQGSGWAWDLGIAVLRAESKTTTSTSAVAATFTTGTNTRHSTFVLVLDDAPGPSIDTQPTDQIVVGANPVTLTVAATTSGGSLTYQWFKNGSSISGATGSSYTFSNLLSDDQAYYYCDVTDSNGTTTTVVVVVYVRSAYLEPRATFFAVDGPSVTTTAALGQMDWAAGRAQPMGAGYRPGEPLPTNIAVVIRPGTSDQGAALARGSKTPQPIPSQVPDPVGSAAASVVVDAVGARTPRAPQPGSVDPPPPRTQPAAGISVTPASARLPPLRVSLSGEATTPSAVPGAGFDNTPAGSRRPAPINARGVEATVAAPAPAPTFDPGSPAARAARAQQPSGADPAPPSAVPGAGISVSPAIARLLAPRLFGNGYPLNGLAAVWWQEAAVYARVQQRQQPDQERFKPLAAAAIAAWGYEPAATSSRASRPVRSDVTGNPLPAIVAAALRAGGLDQPAPGGRGARPRQTFALDPALPTALAAWGWELPAGGSRIVRPAPIAASEPIAAAPVPVTWEAAAAIARGARAEQLRGAAAPPLLALTPVGFEPEGPIARSSAARAAGDPAGVIVIAPPAIPWGWETGAALMRAGRSPIIQATFEAIVSSNRIDVLIFQRVGEGAVAAIAAPTSTDVQLLTASTGVVVEATATGTLVSPTATGILITKPLPTEIT
jgi:hypothetical protein